MKKFSFHFNLIDEDDERIPHGNLTYIVAFLIPLIMFIALYYVREIYPFGDNCYLRSDMYTSTRHSSRNSGASLPMVKVSHIHGT